MYGVCTYSLLKSSVLEEERISLSRQENTEITQEWDLQGCRPAPPEEQGTLDLGAVSSSPTLGARLIENKMKENKV